MTNYDVEKIDSEMVVKAAAQKKAYFHVEGITPFDSDLNLYLDGEKVGEIQTQIKTKNKLAQSNANMEMEID